MNNFKIVELWHVYFYDEEKNLLLFIHATGKDKAEAKSKAIDFFKTKYTDPCRLYIKMDREKTLKKPDMVVE